LNFSHSPAINDDGDVADGYRPEEDSAVDCGDDGNRRLGNIRSEDDLADAGRRAKEDAGLFGAGKRTV